MTSSAQNSQDSKTVAMPESASSPVPVLKYIAERDTRWDLSEDHPQSTCQIAREWGMTRQRLNLFLAFCGKNPDNRYKKMVAEGLMEFSAVYHPGMRKGVPAYYRYRFPVFTPAGIDFLNKKVRPVVLKYFAQAKESLPSYMK